MANRWGNSGRLHILGGSKITADGDCSHEIKRCLLLGRKVMTNLDSILKIRDISLPTKVHLAKAMVFPAVMYGCESWTIKKAEHRRIDAFELWCWRRLLRVPWTARRSNQSILKEMSIAWLFGAIQKKKKIVFSVASSHSQSQPGLLFNRSLWDHHYSSLIHSSKTPTVCWVLWDLQSQNLINTSSWSLLYYVGSPYLYPASQPCDIWLTSFTASWNLYVVFT